MGNTILVTGTDTGVGKTVVTAALAGAMCRRDVDVGVLKPIASGCSVSADGQLYSPDADFLRLATGVEEPDFMISPVCLEPPLAPSVAARLMGARVSEAVILQSVKDLSERHEVLLVEGIGGILVPIDDEALVVDLAERFGMSVLIVARPNLGTINHTLLTIEAIQMRELRVAGVVFCETSNDASDESTATNATEIERITGVHMLGTLPFDAEVDVAGGQLGRIIELADEHLDVDGLVRRECSYGGY